MKKDSTVVLLAFFSLFALLSYFYTPQLKADGYCHFLDGIKAISPLNIRHIVVSVWDKPIPLVLYGTSGLAGLFVARLVSVVLVLLTGGFTLNLARRFIRNMEECPAITVVFFLMLLPVFLQTFLTMTELPAAFILSFGLYLFYSRKAYAAAFIVTGFLPLARVECALIMAFLLATFAVEIFVMHPSGNRQNAFARLKPALGYLLAGSAPFILWNAAGVYFTRDIFWLPHLSYAHVRPFNFLSIIRHNAVTALPTVFTAPALFLFLLGISAPQRNRREGSSPYFFFAIYGTLIVHLSFLSAVIPYPKGELGWEERISAWNDRNFNVIAPVLALFVYMGASYLYELLSTAKDRPKGEIAKTLAESKVPYMFLVSVLLIYVCKREFLFHESSELWVVVLFLFCVVALLPLLGAARTPRKRTFLVAVSGFIICSFLAARPRFWNPTKYNDPDIVIQGELTDWIRNNYGAAKVLVIQDLGGHMEYMIGRHNVRAPWLWPGKFVTQMSSAPSRTLIVIQTLGPSREPFPQYSPQLIEKVSAYRIVKKSSAIWPYGWTLYEKP